jgi:NADPH:quinone reductase-like Zn-dependent oxidoreductase
MLQTYLQGDSQMKAVRIHEFGGPHQIQINDVPVPQIKTGEALIRIHAAGVNPVDWMIREKIYNPEGTEKVPLTLGQDFSGVIESILPDPGSSTTFKAGDEVFGETWGSFAEFAIVSIQDLVRKPKSLDFVTAASIPMPALTAWQIIHDTAHVKPGKQFLIHGASGGVGSFAAQFALLNKAEVVATASQPSFDFLRSIGVKTIIDYKNERFEEQVKDMDVVIDPQGGDVQARSWSVLKKGGMLINLIGEIDQAAARQAGIQTVEFSMEYDTEDLEEIAQLVEQGKVKPHISQVLSLDDARKALDLNQQGKSHGKIVLQVA